jgi:hypothetical protein
MTFNPKLVCSYNFIGMYPAVPFLSHGVEVCRTGLRQYHGNIEAFYYDVVAAIRSQNTSVSIVFRL